jgi:predicted outer membrane repeat protein
MTRWWYVAVLAIIVVVVVVEMLWVGGEQNQNKRIGGDSLSRQSTPRILSQSNAVSSATNLTTATTSSSLGDEDDGTVSLDTIIVLSLLSLVNTAVFVVPNTIRYAARKRQCLAAGQGRNSGNSCICNEAQLQSAIRDSTSRNDNSIAVLIVCPATTLTMTREINVTDASFRLVCAISRFVNTGPCVLTTSSSSPHRFFVGAPESAILQDIVVQRGNASGGAAGGVGGAVYATGGNWTFHNVAFVDNTASSVGGAIYVAAAPSALAIGAPPPPAMVTVFGTTSFRDNVANGGIGNDIYIATKAAAATTSSAFVKCEASSLLSVPAFCNGAGGIVVGSTNATAIEKAIYTNCGAVANFRC